MRKHPPTLRVALEGCVVSDSEHSKAFIYKKYYGYVKAVVLRYVKVEVESEEIINESFVKVFRKLHSFEQHPDDEVLEKTFRSWMARISVNTAIDMLRVKKQMQFIDDEEGTEIGNLSVNMTSSLEANDILKLLDGLPPIQKAIFNLYEIEGYSHEEISKMLDVPESTSRTYLTRAKQKLRILYSKFMDQENIKS
ncbi:RNA polymerase sigma factor [Sphingobacterium chungjuense]|uniref:RNA polymerase sigma factor n=1 Tax=Sphingobacterium chungjuense TaxID=2675553 RepID=UPI001F0D266C|nr:RNA polymerase sigma factor [Sphingobacterium chungjuense]